MTTSESAFDELKTHQPGPRTVLRSKTPDLVTQGSWGDLCCHHAIHTPMLEATEHAGHDPDWVSFVPALRIACRSIAQQGAFPLTAPTALAGFGAHAIGELVRRRLPKRRPHANTRVVKRRHTKCHVKQERHRSWPQADRTHGQATIL